MTLSEWRLEPHGQNSFALLADGDVEPHRSVVVAYVRRDGSLQGVWTHPAVPDHARLLLLVAALRAERCDG